MRLSMQQFTSDETDEVRMISGVSPCSLVSAEVWGLAPVSALALTALSGSKMVVIRAMEIHRATRVLLLHTHNNLLHVDCQRHCESRLLNWLVIRITGSRFAPFPPRFVLHLGKLVANN